MKRCFSHDGNGYNCGSYAFNLDKIGIDQGELCDVHYYKAQRDELLAASKAVVARWDTPLWKNVPATAEYIGALRSAIAKAEGDDRG